MEELQSQQVHEITRRPKSHLDNTEYLRHLFASVHLAEIIAVLSHNLSTDSEEELIEIGILDRETMFDRGILNGYRNGVSGQTVLPGTDKLTPLGEQAVALMRLNPRALSEGVFELESSLD